MPLNEVSTRKVLEAVNITQESVQKTSKWIMDCRQEIDIITKIWFDLYKQGSDDLKTSLVYVMNDTVQKAKHEKDKAIPIAFHPHFVNAATLASDNVKKPIEKCLKVFAERQIYPAHVINEIRAALDGTADSGSTGDGEDVSNLDVDQLWKRFDHYSDACNALDRARRILDTITFDIDASDVRIKSKSGVIELENEAELMAEKLRKFISTIEAQNTRTSKIKQLNQKAVRYYDNQIKDVNVVYDAYDRFAKGIATSRSLLENILKTGLLPNQTPPDAPSPTPSEDLNDGDGDDMEMDQEDKPLSSNPKSALIPPKDYIPFPVYNNPPVSYQPTTSNANISRADPRKLRTATSNNPTTAAFAQLPTLPPELANMLPQSSIPPQFFHQPQQFSDGSSSIPGPANFPIHSDPSLKISPTSSSERHSWRSNGDKNGDHLSAQTPQTPSFEMQNMNFASPPPAYTIQRPGFTSPNQANASPFFSGQSVRPRFVAPRGNQFFTPRGNQQPRHFQADNPNRRRSGEYDNWDSTKKIRRDSFN